MGPTQDPERYAETIGDPIESGINPAAPNAERSDFNSVVPSTWQPVQPDFNPALPAAESAKERRLLRRLSIDIGSDTNPDFLAPWSPKWLERDYEMDYRVVFQDDRLGLNIQRYEPASGRKLSVSYRQRLDFPTEVGLGPARNSVYKSLNQKTRGRDVRGYVAGFAIVFNHHWGVNLSHDEFIRNAPFDRFHRQVTAVGIGYSPLGDDRKERWTFTIDPYLTYEKFHGLIPFAGRRYESFGYAVGPSFYYSLDWVDLPRWLGAKKGSRLDRLRVSVGITDTEVSALALTFDANVTGYLTRHIKLKTGFTGNYQVKTGKQDYNLKLGASLRLSIRDFSKKKAGDK